MSLTLALNNALSGLNVNQRALAALSQNISNANTPGYSRQVVDLSAQYLVGVGTGVKVEDITRKVDTYLQRAITAQKSDTGQADVLNEYMTRAQILFGEPGASNSLDNYLDSFFVRMNNLSINLQDASARQSAVNAGISLAREISNLAMGLEDLRLQADKEIDNGVDYINQEINNLYALNTAINRAYAMNSPTAGLLDQRDTALNNIAEYMDINIYYKESGEVNVYTANGISLLDENRYQLQFSPMATADNFIDNGSVSPLQVVRVDVNGVANSQPIDLISAGVESGVTTVLSRGRFKALKDIRDKAFPDMLAQLDTLAAGLRDEFNALHNDGSGYPGAHTLTGTRELYPTSRSDWSGKVMIGVVDDNGIPVGARYTDEEGGFRPLTLDLASLDSGSGVGQPSLQAIINEINAHFGTPQPKAKVGNLNNITLVSDTNTLPGLPPQFTFDFELENISATNADFFVSNIVVRDSTGTDITNITTNVPSVSLSTYTTTAGSSTVQINTASPHGFVEGQRIYLTDPGAAVNGIPNAELTGYFTIQNVTSTTFEIVASTPAGAGPAVPATTVARANYDTAIAGEKSRTRDQGMITQNLSLNPTSPFYTVTATVGVDDGFGGLSTSTIEYRIPNNTTSLMNDRYAPTSVNGAGTLIFPSTNQGVMRAKLVDENGVELPTINGDYVNQPGYLVLESLDGTFNISISELNSSENGLATAIPAQAGSGRGFSHYFELNNFFHSNQPIAGGDTLTNSAVNLAVESRFISDANLLSTGQLTRSLQPSNTEPRTLPLVTDPFQTNAGSNVIVVTTQAAHGFTEGDYVNFAYNGLTINGIPASQINGTKKVTIIDEHTFSITVVSNATAGGTGGGSGLAVTAQPEELPTYTYERKGNDNKIAAKLAKLATDAINLAAAGGLPTSNVSLTGYAGSILSYASSSAISAESNLEDNNILLEGFVNRAQAISGVNLDEELANTVIYQNAYAASARVITVTDELFDALLAAFN